MYSNKIVCQIDIHHIQERQFFDVYEETFVPYAKLDLQTVHMIKRNADTYAFFDQKKQSCNRKTMEEVNEIQNLFDAFFSDFEQTLLQERFGQTYETYIAKEKEKEETFNGMMEGLKQFATNIRNKQFEMTKQRQTHLNGFQQFDHLEVQTGIYKGMKACVKDINFEKEEIGIVFFGETNYDNVISIKTDHCIKI